MVRFHPGGPFARRGDDACSRYLRSRFAGWRALACMLELRARRPRTRVRAVGNHHGPVAQSGRASVRHAEGRGFDARLDHHHGAVAQQGERCRGTAEAAGSRPASSTNNGEACTKGASWPCKSAAVGSIPILSTIFAPEVFSAAPLASNQEGRVQLPPGAQSYLCGPTEGRRSSKPKGGGSSPSRGAIVFTHVAQRKESPASNRWGGGSNPSVGANVLVAQWIERRRAKPGLPEVRLLPGTPFSRGGPTPSEAS